MTAAAQPKRLAGVDCARALCMLYIVGVHHMQSFVAPGTVIDRLANHAQPALYTFTALSALFLGRRAMDSAADVRAFLRRRLVRAYPLYLLGCLTLFVVSLAVGKYFHGVRQLALTLAGLSMVFGPAPRTMWYMSMLLLFWALTPLFNWRHRATGASAALRAGLLLALLAAFRGLQLLGTGLDSRLYGHAAVYFGALILADFAKLEDRPNPAWLALVALGALLARLPDFPRGLGQNLAGVAAILFAGQLCALLPPLAAALGWVSYASMNAYLFHRQWLGLGFYLLGPFSLPLAAAMLAALLAGCWAVQRGYDAWVVPRIEGRGKRE